VSIGTLVMTALEQAKLALRIPAVTCMPAIIPPGRALALE
jgi:hypothetical protein